jgi:hypothetical protein
VCGKVGPKQAFQIRYKDIEIKLHNGPFQISEKSESLVRLAWPLGPGARQRICGGFVAIGPMANTKETILEQTVAA